MEVELEHDSDHCIVVSTNVTLEFADGPTTGSNRTDAIAFLEDRFELDVESGIFFREDVPTPTRREFRAIRSARTPAGNVTTTISHEPVVGVAPAPPGYYDVDGPLEGEEEDSRSGGSSNAAGIAAALCVGLVAVGTIGLFVHHRRRGVNRLRRSYSWWISDDKSHSEDGTTTRVDSSKSDTTPDFDIERVNPFLVDDDDESKTSFRDRAYQAQSVKGLSVASFSGSDDSDDSATSSAKSSAENSEGGDGAFRGSSNECGFSWWTDDKSHGEDGSTRRDLRESYAAPDIDIEGVNDFKDESHGEDGTTRVDSCESYKTPDFVIEGVNPFLKGRADDDDDDDDGSKAFSRDQISLSESVIDSSIASFLEIDDSDGSSTSSTESSVDKSKGSDGASRGRSISSYQSSASTSTSDVDDGCPLSKGPMDDPKDVRAGRKVARAVAAIKREPESKHSNNVASAAEDASMGSDTPTDDDFFAAIPFWEDESRIELSPPGAAANNDVGKGGTAPSSSSSSGYVHPWNRGEPEKGQNDIDDEDYSIYAASVVVVARADDAPTAVVVGAAATPATNTTAVPPLRRARVVPRPLSPESAGSSGWDSSDDTGSLESYASELDSSKSCGKTR